MLVIDRKIQEGFWIDGRIFVKVLGIGRRRVKLGIDAPDDVTVLREELLRKGEGRKRDDSGGKGNGDFGNDGGDSSPRPAEQSPAQAQSS